VCSFKTQHAVVNLHLALFKGRAGDNSASAKCNQLLAMGLTDSCDLSHPWDSFRSNDFRLVFIQLNAHNARSMNNSSGCCVARVICAQKKHARAFRRVRIGN